MEEDNSFHSVSVAHDLQDFMNCIDSFDVPNFEGAFDECPVYTASISNENTPNATTSYVSQIDHNNESAG